MPDEEIQISIRKQNNFFVHDDVLRFKNDLKDIFMEIFFRK